MSYLNGLLTTSRLTNLSPVLYRVTQTNSFTGISCAHLNRCLTEQLGIDAQVFSDDRNLALLINTRLNPDVHPIATMYAGHQFGIYTSSLGDGRVHILGDISTNDNDFWEIQLKGAGATPFARGNNGLMTMAEAINEYLACEAMAGLGVPCTRGLAIVNVSDGDMRADRSLRQSILMRTAKTHLRFGHFEYLHNQGKHSELVELTDHVIEQYYPELLDFNGSYRYLCFLYAVTRRTAYLLAKWQSVGFVHSVMNTDNMSIIGITLDLGVYGFMQAYDPAFSANENDDQNRYAFDQQVDVARWNCLALAEALSELLPDKCIPANLLRYYRKSYSENYQSFMRQKLGLQETDVEDISLVTTLLGLLRQHKIDYTQFFRTLCQIETYGPEIITAGSNEWRRAFSSWFKKYQNRLGMEKTHSGQRESMMLASNAKFVLRPELVEHTIQQAEQNNFKPLHELVTVLQNPFDEHESYERFAGNTV